MAGNTLIIRWLIILFLFLGAIVGGNFLLWYSDHHSLNETAVSENDATRSSNKEGLFTVEKLNHQMSVKQLRQALIHDALPQTDHLLSGDDIDRQTKQLEQELKALTSQNE